MRLSSRAAKDLDLSGAKGTFGGEREREGKGMERGPNTGLELSTLFFGACLLAWFLARGGTRTKRDKKAQPTLK